MPILFSHYRRHPIQALFLIAGITIANVLLVGTTLINAQARASYDRNTESSKFVPQAFISAADGARHFDENDYFKLRQQGFDQLAPILYWFTRTESGQSVELTGIDIFAMPRNRGARNGTLSRSSSTLSRSSSISDTRASASDFISPPFQLWAAPSRLKQLKAAEGQRINLTGSDFLPPLAAVEDQQLGHRMLIDIGALQNLSGLQGQLSGMFVFAGGSRSRQELQHSLPSHLVLSEQAISADPAELTASFHLNLTAMGLLAFVVGVFLMFNAISFSYTDRHDLIRKLKLCGVSRRQLAVSLLAELLVFTIFGLVLGYVLGAVLAQWLLPGVGQTLAQLYGVYIAYPGFGTSFSGAGVFAPLMMTLLACLLCAVFPLRSILLAPPIRRQIGGWQIASTRKRDLALLATGIGLLILCWSLIRVADSLTIALMCMACLLLGAALCLPAGLRAILKLISAKVPEYNAEARWLLADTRWLLGPASIALMAMTLALVSNSGLNTMINSFRQATDSWLQQRLSAQLYLSASTESSDIRAWLESNVPEAQLVNRYQKTISIQSPGQASVQLEINSLPNTAEFRDSLEFIKHTPRASDLFISGKGIYLSERANIIDNWALDDSIEICPGQPAMQVVGFYRNYGNPRSQGIVNEPAFLSCWVAEELSGRAITGPENLDWPTVGRKLAEKFQYSDQQVMSPVALKAVGLAVFDRTFAVTRALDVLTLLVAGIGIFCSISAIHHHRRRQQAVLACLGLAASKRAWLQVCQWGLLGLLCTVIVWPFGTALAWVLAQVVTPAAFGWSFPVQLHWQHFPMLLLLASSCLLIAGLLAGIRTLRVSPGELLKDLVT